MVLKKKGYLILTLCLVTCGPHLIKGQEIDKTGPGYTVGMVAFLFQDYFSHYTNCVLPTQMLDRYFTSSVKHGGGSVRVGTIRDLPGCKCCKRWLNWSKLYSNLIISG